MHRISIAKNLLLAKQFSSKFSAKSSSLSTISKSLGVFGLAAGLYIYF
jgi:hypothetical protein